MLAFTGVNAVAQGYHGADGTVHGPEIMRVDIAGGQRGTVFIAGRVDEATQRPHHYIRVFIVSVRPLLSEAGDGGHNDAGVNLAQVIIAQAQAVQVAGGK